MENTGKSTDSPASDFKILYLHPFSSELVEILSLIKCKLHLHHGCYISLLYSS